MIKYKEIIGKVVVHGRLEDLSLWGQRAVLLMRGIPDQSRSVRIQHKIRYVKGHLAKKFFDGNMHHIRIGHIVLTV